MLFNTMPCHATPRLAIPHRAVPILTCRPPDGTAADTNPEQHKRGMQLAAQGTVNKVLGESETIKGPEQIQRRELRRAGRHSPGTVPLRLGRAAGRKAVCLSVRPSEARLGRASKKRALPSAVLLVRPGDAGAARLTRPFQRCARWGAACLLLRQVTHIVARAQHHSPLQDVSA